MRRKRASLSVKFIAGFVILIIIISVISICFGYHKYSKSKGNGSSLRTVGGGSDITPYEGVNTYSEFVKDDKEIEDQLVRIGIIVLFILFYIIWFHRGVIRPVKKIGEEAEAFTAKACRETDTGYKLSEELLKIKTGDEIEQLARSVYNLEENIENRTRELVRIARESEREKAELGIAGRIQKDILPTDYPAFPDRHEFDIYAVMTPARQVGGDFYDYFFIDERHLAMVIADVTGKGMPAALFMVIAKTMIRNRAMSGGEPSEILHDANEQLCEGNDTHLFVSAWLGILDIHTGRLRMANAGHEYPVIMGQDGEYKLYKDKHGLVMGLRPDIKYTDTDISLETGDTVFVYTDGVPDAENSSKGAFGIQRMLDVLNDLKKSTVPDTLNGILDAVMSHSDSDYLFDDITMLCVRYLGEGSGGIREMVLEAYIENTPGLMKFLEDELLRVKAGGKYVRRIELALEELFVNICNYAYPEETGDVTVRISYPAPLVIEIELIDQGVQYDPCKKPDPDMKVSLKERGAGGMGIYLAKSFMDEMEYEYRDRCNHLRMRKKLAKR